MVQWHECHFDKLENFAIIFWKNLPLQSIPSFIYSWSISHILEHKFFCLGGLGSSGQLWKNSISKQLLMAWFFQLFVGTQILILIVRERGFINQLYIELGIIQQKLSKTYENSRLFLRIFLLQNLGRSNFQINKK